MTLEAAYLEESTPVDETEDVTVIDLNPFGLKGEKDRLLLIRKNGEPVLLLQLYIRADDDGWLISSAFSEFLLNDTHVAIICGDHFHDLIWSHTRSEAIHWKITSATFIQFLTSILAGYTNGFWSPPTPTFC